MCDLTPQPRKEEGGTEKERGPQLLLPRAAEALWWSSACLPLLSGIAGLNQGSSGLASLWAGVPSLASLELATPAMHLSNLSFSDIQCTGSLFVGVFYEGYYFTLPSIPLGLPQHVHPLWAVAWESGRSWEDRDLAVPSFCICPVLSEPSETFDCFPRQQKPCWQPPGKVSVRETWESGWVGCPFFCAFSSSAGPFICCSEALLMQKEYIQPRVPWRAVGIIMPLFIILKQTQFGVWISLEVWNWFLLKNNWQGKSTWPAQGQGIPPGASSAVSMSPASPAGSAAAASNAGVQEEIFNMYWAPAGCSICSIAQLLCKLNIFLSFSIRRDWTSQRSHNLCPRSHNSALAGKNSIQIVLTSEPCSVHRTLLWGWGQYQNYLNCETRPSEIVPEPRSGVRRETI